MANPEHVEVVKKGGTAIAEWRRKHPKQTLDLEYASLENAHIDGANLSGANLFRAVLSHAHLTKVKLRRANLSEALLDYANLRAVDFTSSNLKAATLLEASMETSALTYASLEGANLFTATLIFNLFKNADLAGVDLTYAQLSYDWFTGANFRGARFGCTSIAHCDLAWCIGLEATTHESPSSIGIDTLVESFKGAGNRLTPQLEAFFLNAGVPKEILEALPQIMAEVKYCTCFICYGQPDLGFAQKLVADLRTKGVSCWLYDMDAIAGRKTWTEIVMKRRELDKMIVLCSGRSLVRDGVLKEIEEQIDEDPDKMVPISLDDLWKEPGLRVVRGQRDLKPFLLDKNYADFTKRTKYEESLAKLLKGLKREGK